MLEFLSYSFIQKALIGGSLLGIICPLIGCFLLLRKYSLISDTLSHVSLTGALLGSALNLPPLLTAIPLSILTGTYFDNLRSNKKINSENVLSIILSLSFALSLVLSGFSKNKNLITTFLFGSISSITNSDLITILVISLISIILLAVHFQKFFFICIDEENAKISGLNIKKLNFLLIGLSALIVTSSIQIIGVMLISGLLIIPSLTAFQLSKNFKTAFFLSSLFGILSIWIGITVSYLWNIYPSASIILTSFLFYMLSHLLQIPRNSR